MISKKKSDKNDGCMCILLFRMHFLLLFFHFLIWIDTYKIMEWVVGLAHIQASTFSLALTLKITVGCPSSAYPGFLVETNLYTRVGLLGSYWKKERKGSCGHSSSRRRQLQTGHTHERLARIFRLLRPCLETLLRNWHSLWTL